MIDNSELQTLLQQVSQTSQQVLEQQFALDQAAIVAMTDAKGIITYVNDKFVKISKYSEEELLGKTHRVINSGYHDKNFFKNLWQTIAKGEVWSGLICNRAKDNSIYWVDTTIVPLLSKDGKPYKYIAIRYEVTKLIETEKQLDEERGRLYESEKMASLGLLSSGLSHELGNPLSALRGRIEMLKNSAEDGSISNEEIQQESQKMLDLVDRMNKIIRGLRTYARDGRQDPKVSVNLTTLVKDIVEISRERCRKNQVQVELEGFDKPHYILGREAELGQVIVNLFNNAVDAAKDLDDKWVKMELIESANELVFRIIDSGKGIPQEVIAKIFDPFFTTKGVGQGTGLGLSISKSIVENHNGTLSIDQKNPNTCFVLNFPKED